MRWTVEFLLNNLIDRCNESINGAPALPACRLFISSLLITTIFKLAAALAFAGLGPAAQAQDGGKMLEKEGKTDGRMLRENRRMMRDGRVKHGESLSKGPRLLKAENHLEHRHPVGRRENQRSAGPPH